VQPTNNRLGSQRLSSNDCWWAFKNSLKHYLPTPLLTTYRVVYQLTHNWQDTHTLTAFLLRWYDKLTLLQRLYIVKSLLIASVHIKCAHTEDEMIQLIEAILSIPEQIEGCIVEAGAYKGGSATKLSIVAKLTNRNLVVFDSFEGVPENCEPHDKNIWGESVSFKKGSYTGTIEEVKENIEKYGCPEVCRFVKGWFDNTMPRFSEPIATAYLDVDLASSTRTCLKYLYPLVVPGGCLFTQDGHLPLVNALLKDEWFWTTEVGCQKPSIERLGVKKLLKIRKPPASH